MCMLVIEILFLIAGLILVITGKIPTKFFAVLFGKGYYALPPTKARLFGLLLASPFPVIISIAFILGLVFGNDATVVATVVEIVYDLVIVVAAIIIARKIRQPIPPPTVPIIP